MKVKLPDGREFTGLDRVDILDQLELVGIKDVVFLEKVVQGTVITIIEE